MPKLSLIYIILISISVLCSAQTIEKINISGNREFGRSDYLQWSDVRPGSRIYTSISDSVRKRINIRLIERGYFHSDIKVSLNKTEQDTQKIDLDIFISEGKPTYINKIYLLGVNKQDSVRIIRLFNFQAGEVFNNLALEGNFSQILDYFEENGQPFARVIVSSVDFMTDSSDGNFLADIYLKVDPGKTSKIDRIEIKGNSRTKDYVILREARLNSGIDYSQSKIEEIPKKLNRLRFFEPVEVPSFYFNSRNEGILSIEVKEKETNNFDGIIGYLPSERTGEKGYLTGLVNVSLRNLLGTGRAAAVRWQQIDRFSQELELKYLEPWVLSYPLNINLGLSQQKQDSSYVKRKLEGAMEFLASENLSASFILSSESVIPTENENSIFTVYNSTVTSTGVNLKLDTRDDIYAPSEGIYMLNSYAFSRKRINGPAKYISSAMDLRSSLQRFSLDISFFKEVLKRQVVAVGLHARELKGDKYEISDLYRLGGTNTLRGYRENQFLGNRLLWSNLEFRQPFSRRSYGFLFFDSGYYLRDEDAENNIPRSSGFKTGYGMGLNLETGFGVLSVSYALAKGDSFSQGKIHFGIINEF